MALTLGDGLGSLQSPLLSQARACFIIQIALDLLTADTRTEVGKRFGGGARYERIWDLIHRHKKMARLLNDAPKECIVPMTVDLT
jgi:hypothetical protein